LLVLLLLITLMLLLASCCGQLLLAGPSWHIILAHVAEMEGYILVKTNGWSVYSKWKIYEVFTFPPSLPIHTSTTFLCDLNSFFVFSFLCHQVQPSPKYHLQ
jgi:hypothetical protein